MISDAISIVPASAWDSATSLSGVTAYAPAAKRQFPHWRLLRLSVSNTNSAEINVDVLPSTDVSRILVYQQALFVRWSLAVRQHLVAVTATSAEAVQSAVAQHRGELAALDESLKDADSRAEDQTALSCSDPAVRSRLAWLQDALCQGHAACGAAAVAAITGRAESPQACASAWSAWLQASHSIIQRLKPVQASAASSPRAVPALPSLPPLPARPVPSGVKTKETLRMCSAAAAQQLVAAWQRAQQASLLGPWLYVDPSMLAEGGVARDLHTRHLLSLPPCITASIPTHFKVGVALPRSLEAVWDDNHECWSMQPRLLRCSAQVLACDLVLRSIPSASHEAGQVLTVLPLTLVRRVLLSSAPGQGEWLQLLCAGGSRGGVTIHAENRNDLALAIQRAVSNVYDVELPLTHGDAMLAPVQAAHHLEGGAHRSEGGAAMCPLHMEVDSEDYEPGSDLYICTSALGCGALPDAPTPRPEWQHPCTWIQLPPSPNSGMQGAGRNATAAQLVYNVGFGTWSQWRPHVLAQWAVQHSPHQEAEDHNETHFWALTGTHLLEITQWTLKVQSAPAAVHWVHRLVTRATPLACIVALASTPPSQGKDAGIRIVAHVPELQQQDVPAPLSPSGEASVASSSGATAPHIATAASASIAYACTVIQAYFPQQWRLTGQSDVHLRLDARAVHEHDLPQPVDSSSAVAVPSSHADSHALAAVRHHAAAVCAAAADGTVGAATLLLGPLLDEPSPLWVGPSSLQGLHARGPMEAVFDAWAVHDVAVATGSEMTDTLVIIVL